MLDSRTSEALRQAMASAQAGRVAEARQLAEGALASGGDVVSLNAFLGMLLARGGDLVSAVPHLRRAHEARPTDVTIACNLIAALIDVGNSEGAFAAARQDLAFADASLRIARYRGFLAQSLENFEEAILCYDHVVTRAPDDFESWNNLGNAHSALGNFDASVTALEKAIELNPNAPPTRLNLATALFNADRADDAERMLRKATEDFREDSRAWHELYVTFKSQNRQEEALTAIEEAIKRDGENANLQLKLGIEYGLVKRVADAETAFRRAIALDPLTTDAYLGLAVQYEHTNREDEFAPLAALAALNGLEEGPVAFIRALEDRRTGRFAEALEAIKRVPAATEPERTAHIRATLLDRLDRPDEAFEAFQESNDFHASSSTRPLKRADVLRSTLRREIDTLSAAWMESWYQGNPAALRPDPTFLVGFPRSGTTLLDTILMGHPGTVVLEEQPPLNRVDAGLGGMLAIPAMDDQAIEVARARYFAEVDAIDATAPTQLLIDKSPLFLQKAPLIERLFPSAKFILVLRHPCDVLLSCFMSNFLPNDAMSNFLRIEDAAEFYDLTFQHWEKSRALFPLNVHTIHYEQLIEDTSGEVSSLFDYLGLDWHEAALDHTKTAKSRGLITTASYSQVTEPIYKRAAGRWERYRKHLEPVFPVLEPWVKKFGYSL